MLAVAGFDQLLCSALNPCLSKARDGRVDTERVFPTSHGNAAGRHCDLTAVSESEARARADGGPPQRVEVGDLGQKQLKKAEDHRPPGQRARAVSVCPGSPHSLVHRIVAGAAVYGLQGSPLPLLSA